MKLVDVEVFHDRSKIIFYFTAPGRIDFRDLVKDLVKNYHTRIELRQIGVRHETQMLGAIGNCGQICCCRRFMRKFAPVTIKMAKEQNLFLNPAKISGMCGRLLCCLNFEQGNYDEFQRKCPKIGKRLNTTLGTVKILRTNLFRETVSLLTENGEEKELTLSEWQEVFIGAAPDSQTQSHPEGRPGTPGEAPSPAPVDAQTRIRPASPPGRATAKERPSP
jgi:cell fate regulator YaaT (PSP1 superfamily)